MSKIQKFIMEAKKGKNKDGDAAKRSRFLGLVMKHMSGDEGKAMADAIEGKNLEKFKELWNNATGKIITSLEESFKKE